MSSSEQLCAWPRRRLLASAALGAVLAASASGAMAAEASAPAVDTVSEVVVTGSLITNKNYVSSSPIVQTSTEQIKQSGAVSLEASLNQLPQFAPSGTAGNGGQGTGGHATVNLHGLGSNRNLVLLDGRRLPLADIAGNVDINLIPDSILSAVDVITGGASAVYGSDAMSGVVNFRTLNRFEGVKADVQYGNAFKGDYQQVSGSVALGANFNDDRGHVLMTFGYTDREGLKGSRRSFFKLVTPSSFIGMDTFVPSAANLPSQAVVNTLFGHYGSATPVANTLNLGFNDDGTLFTQTGAKNYKGPTSGAYALIAGNVRMPVGPQTYIENPFTRKSFFTKFDYELTPSVTAYGQVLYVDSTVFTSSGGSLTQFGALTTIPVTNPFIPTDLRTLLASRPNPNAPFTWNGRYVGLPAKAWDEKYTTTQFLGGLKGDLPIKNWTWDVFSSFDTTDHLQSNYNAVLKSQVQTLLNAPDGGASICAGGFNPFGVVHSSVISAACRNYMTITAHSTEKLTQANTQGVIQGPIFTLPAGDVNLALLADYRRNTYVYTPDSQLAAQNIEAVIASQASRGAVSVTDYAAQIDVPLLRDAPFAYRLNVGAAYRYSDYNPSGGVSSYEGEAKWWPVEQLLFRGSYQRAVRAPNIGELFAANSGSQIAFGTPPASIGDPCDVRSNARTGANGASVRTLCLAQGIPAAVIDSYQFPTTATAGLTHGNINLTPETADTYNVGAVWTSRSETPLLRNVSVSVDYWNIDIQNVISVIPGLTALSKCYNLDGSNPTYSPANSFCALLSRDSSGLLQVINTPYLNLGGLKTDGVDIQLNWRAAVADLGLSGLGGEVSVNSGISYTNHYSVQTLPNTKFAEFAGTNTIGASYPKWKALTTFSYRDGPAMVALRWRYLDSMKDVTSVTTPATPGIGVKAYDLFDLIGTFDVRKSWQVRAGVTNLFDKGLPIVSSSQTSTDTSVYDAVGRSFYLGLRATF
jgi:iron complex outermembrane receptor protein